MDSRTDRVWTIPLWCQEAHFSRGWWYLQSSETLPKHINSGRAVRIYESPREYCERMARESAEKRVAEREAA